MGLLNGERYQRQLPRSLDGDVQLALPLGGQVRGSARADLARVRDVLTYERQILVVYLALEFLDLFLRQTPPASQITQCIRLSVECVRTSQSRYARGF